MGRVGTTRRTTLQDCFAAFTPDRICEMGDQFVTTHWSVVLQAANGSSATAAQAFEDVCRTYWRPLFAFARRRGLSEADSEDAVQGFLASVVRYESIRNVRQENGRFRTWLLSGLKNHLCDEHARSTALKRGGGLPAHLPLDTTDADGICAQSIATSDSPDLAFDRAWSLSIMALAKARLREECQASGKGGLFEAVFPAAQESVTETYEQIAARLGISPVGARAAIHRLRRRWRELIRAEVGKTVCSREALEEELDHLKASLR